MLDPAILNQEWDKLTGYKCPQIDHEETRWWIEVNPNYRTVGALCTLTQADFNTLYQQSEIARCKARLTETPTAHRQAALDRAQQGQFPTRGRDAAWHDIAALQAWANTPAVVPAAAA